MSEIVVPNFGIHWAVGDLAFLQQAKGGANAIGVNTKSPFRVQPVKRGKECNHLIPLATPVPAVHHVDVFHRVFHDPLVQAMLPVPHEGSKVFYVVDDGDRLLPYLTALMRLSSPIYAPVIPMWTVSNKAVLFDELSTTNVQPFVIVGMKSEHGAILSDLGQAAVFHPRTVICTGASEVVLPSTVKRIETKIFDMHAQDLAILPMESIGAVIVRYYMRKEWTLGQDLPNINRDKAQRVEQRRVFRHPR